MAGKSNASAKARQVRTQKYIDIAVSKGANVTSAAVNKAARETAREEEEGVSWW